MFSVACTAVFRSANVYAASCNGVETSLIECEDDGKAGSGIFQLLKKVLDIMTALIGVVATIGIAVAGVQYLTAKDNENQVAKAKRRIFELVLGLAVYVLIYAFLGWLLPNVFDEPNLPDIPQQSEQGSGNESGGNISDLGESFVATPVACILIAMQVFKDNPAALAAACLFPFVLSASGLLSSLVGVTSVIFANRKKKKVGPDGQEIVVSREISDPAIELDLATYLSAITVFIIGLVGAYLVFGGVPGMFKYGWIAPWGAAAFGVVSSVLVGKVTERYTGMKYASV